MSDCSGDPKELVITWGDQTVTCPAYKPCSGDTTIRSMAELAVCRLVAYPEDSDEAEVTVCTSQYDLPHVSMAKKVLRNANLKEGDIFLWDMSKSTVATTDAIEVLLGEGESAIFRRVVNQNQLQRQCSTCDGSGWYGYPGNTLPEGRCPCCNGDRVELPPGEELPLAEEIDEDYSSKAAQRIEAVQQEAKQDVAKLKRMLERKRLARKVVDKTGWPEAQAEANSLAQYKPNWDGEGADVVHPVLIDSLKKLFDHLENASFVAPDSTYPLADGTIMLEWHLENDLVISANIRQAGLAEVLLFRPNCPSSHFKVTWSHQ